MMIDELIEGMTDMNYYRIMLGRQSIFSEECYTSQFIGADFDFDFDLSDTLPENASEFRRTFIPYFLERRPDRSRIAAGLACGALHTVCKAIRRGDKVLCPNGDGQYLVGEIISDYYYEPTQNLPHRRKVSWLPEVINREEMSQALQYSAGSIGTVSNISQYHEEINALIGGQTTPTLISTDELVEDPNVFALEKHLEDFLVKNWVSTELGVNYDIVEHEGEVVGQQYPSDTGPIDILAISKDRNEYLVVELKKGRASDAVVGQIQRYMGFVQEELLEDGQIVRGIIIALDDDLRLRRALQVTSNIDFYRYQINFNLIRN